MLFFFAIRSVRVIIFFKFLVMILLFRLFVFFRWCSRAHKRGEILIILRNFLSVFLWLNYLWIPNHSTILLFVPFECVFSNSRWSIRWIFFRFNHTFCMNGKLFEFLIVQDLLLRSNLITAIFTTFISHFWLLIVFFILWNLISCLQRSTNCINLTFHFFLG